MTLQRSLQLSLSYLYSYNIWVCSACFSIFFNYDHIVSLQTFYLIWKKNVFQLRSGYRPDIHTLFRQILHNILTIRSDIHTSFIHTSTERFRQPPRRKKTKSKKQILTLHSDIHTLFRQILHNILNNSFRHSYIIHTHIQSTFSSLHHVHIQFTSSSYPVYIQFTSSSHPFHIQFTSCSQHVHIQFVSSLHPVHIQFVLLGGLVWIFLWVCVWIMYECLNGLFECCGESVWIMYECLVYSLILVGKHSFFKLSKTFAKIQYDHSWKILKNMQNILICYSYRDSWGIAGEIAGESFGEIAVAIETALDSWRDSCRDPWRRAGEIAVEIAIEIRDHCGDSWRDSCRDS